MSFSAAYPLETLQAGHINQNLLGHSAVMSSQQTLGQIFSISTAASSQITTNTGGVDPKPQWIAIGPIDTQDYMYGIYLQLTLPTDAYMQVWVQETNSAVSPTGPVTNLASIIVPASITTTSDASGYSYIPLDIQPALDSNYQPVYWYWFVFPGMIDANRCATFGASSYTGTSDFSTSYDGINWTPNTSVNLNSAIVYATANNHYAITSIQEDYVASSPTKGRALVWTSGVTNVAQVYLVSVMDSVSYQVPAAQQNLMSNAMANYQAGWTYTGGSSSFTEPQNLIGSSTLQTIQPTTASAYTALVSDKLSINAYTVEFATPNYIPTNYLFTAGTYVIATNGTRSFNLSLSWYDSTGTLISTTTGTSVAANGNWQAVYVTGAAPYSASLSYVVISVELSSGNASGECYWLSGATFYQAGSFYTNTTAPATNFMGWTPGNFYISSGLKTTMINTVPVSFT